MFSLLINLNIILLTSILLILAIHAIVDVSSKVIFPKSNIVVLFSLVISKELFLNNNVLSNEVWWVS